MKNKKRKKRFGLIQMVLLLCVSLQVFRVEAPAYAEGANFANIVLFAYFAGDTEGAAYFEENTERIMKIYDGTQNCSFTNYLNHISYGQLQVKNYYPQYDGTKITALELSVTEQKVQESGNMDPTILADAIAKAPTLQNKLVDYDNDGYIDNVTVILRSKNNSTTSGNSLVAHHQFYAGSLSYASKKLGHYNMVNTVQFLGTGEGDVSAQECAVIAHEFLHTVGFPDLYTSDGSVPVGCWDLMGKAYYIPSYPLAYMRMHCGGWLTLDTVTTSQTLTLDTQDTKDGHPAYILKSPLNETEYFVVEYRQKLYTPDTYDRFVGGSGVIVYRINPTVEDLSNMHGGTGVYVFRPQSGKTGYVEDGMESVSTAFLSSESGRVTIGKADLSAGLTDGALTFSDGSNSGIVIREVGSAQGKQITLTVDIPTVEENSLWENTAFPSATGNMWNKIAMTMQGEVPYVLTYTKDNKALTVYSYTNQTWTKRYQETVTDSYIDMLQLCSYGGSIYYAYQGDNGICVRKLGTNGTQLSEQTTIAANGYSFDLKSGTDGVYLAYLSDNKTAHMKKFVTGSLSVQTDCGNYCVSSDYLGQPQLLAVGNQLYAFVRNSNGNRILMYRMDAPGVYTELSDTAMIGSTYMTATDGTNVYMVSNQDGITVWRYDQTNWNHAKMENTNFSDMAAVCRQGTLFVLAAKNESTNLYRYDVGQNQFAQEGVTLDSYATSQTICAVGGTLYAAYVRQSDSCFAVKKKTVHVAQVPSPTPPTTEDTTTETPTTETPTTETPTTGATTTETPTTGVSTTETPTTGATTTETPTTEQPTTETPTTGATTTETPTTEQPTTEVPAVTVSYRTHIQTFGWEKTWRKNGSMSGTSGKAKRLEGIEIKVSGNDRLGIQYTTHCQSYGWLPWAANGDMSGTEGEAKRLEAIKIQLTGADKEQYDVYYRVHAQTFGWLGWVKNGAPAGTAGYAKRLEGIQILIVKKGQTINPRYGNIVSATETGYYAKTGLSPIVNAKPTSNLNPQIPGADAPNVLYRTHVQSYGWQGYKYNGQMSGTEGVAKRLEGIQIKLSNAPYEGDICYTTHVQSYGWQGNLQNRATWKKNGKMSGTEGEAKRLEAICISLTGDMEKYYDVYYRVHAQTFGWLGWAKNGAPAGTAGYAKRLEGIEICLVKKGQKAPGSTARAYIAR